MNDSYKELLVKKESGMKEAALRALSVIVTIVAALMIFMLQSIFVLIIAVGFGVLTYFVYMWTDLEYEYLYLDKEITIDKIMGKSKRKRVAVIDVNKMEILAPATSYQLDSYKNRKVSEFDYSAGSDLPEQKLYHLYYDGNNKYILNLNDDFAKTIKGIAPRKVFTD